MNVEICSNADEKYTANNSTAHFTAIECATFLIVCVLLLNVKITVNEDGEEVSFENNQSSTV